jgi:hypothetical protein
MPLLVLDATLGLLLLAVIAWSSRARVQQSENARAIGALLVAVPLPSVVVLHVLGALPTATDQTLFVLALVAFAVGSILLLGSRDDDEWREASDDSPPWWPEFERAFRSYDRESRRPHIYT